MRHEKIRIRTLTNWTTVRSFNSCLLAAKVSIDASILDPLSRAIIFKRWRQSGAWMWNGTNLPLGREITFGTPPLSVVLIAEIWGALKPSATKVKGQNRQQPRHFCIGSKDSQTPFSNCWSINEFAVGVDDVARAEGEVGDCSERESNDSSTVESGLCFVDSEGLDRLLLELLAVNSVSKD